MNFMSKESAGPIRPRQMPEDEDPCLLNDDILALQLMCKEKALASLVFIIIVVY